MERQVDTLLACLAAGDPPSQVEISHVDVKEEPGRRGPGGIVNPGAAQNDDAARYLAGEMACFANTPGGGAIILGVADDGLLIGTELDADWLRHRIWQLTEQKLTISVQEAQLASTRLLVLTTHEAIEPIRYSGRLTWRVSDNCVEVDATTWHAGRIQRTGIDWSALPSGHSLHDVNPAAVEVARRYLKAVGDDPAQDLAGASVEDLVRRLNLVDGESQLTNAGSLLFVGTPGVGIDYIRRDYPGADSTLRIRGEGPLLEQVWEVDRASQAANRVIELSGPFSSAFSEAFAGVQFRAIPPRALREAIVNGVVHRDWLSTQPTTVEHVGDIVTVTSPGGFVGGVSPSNIITHPSAPRYRGLAEAMASLRLAEREGIGVDRMVRDMLALGLPEPEITQVDGPYVRVGLIGGAPDKAIIDLLASVEPSSVGSRVDALLIIDHLCRHGWIDVATAAPVLQRPKGETLASIEQLAHATVGGDPVLVTVAGVPANDPPAFRFGDAARSQLAARVASLYTAEGRPGLILEWATRRGRVSSTEAADIADLSGTYAGSVLTGLEADGHLAPCRENRAGRGFFYLPIDGPES